MIIMSVQLEKLGYTKKTCKTCGNDFWSIGERETCGDAPCDEYQFIGNPATPQKYDLFSIQDLFIRFFQERGHTPIRRYPVLAKRWRDDVFLVGASIYNFQPWVTSGQTKPPANPLVVAQPSIRLNDVDNVGRTGRHMTCFTMGAHHAFNSPEDEIYWKDETVKYCHDFITHLGINGEEITFIESWWEGGGNSGPCYEVCVRGVELATLVFIQYRTLPGGEKEEIPLKIVDTGYGLERFAWISQGTPTAYDASFGPVIKKLQDMSGVELNHRILGENAQVAGMMDIEDIADLKVLRSKVAQRLGITVEELKEATEPMEAIYVIADHTRCLAFMLADGVIPSNVKEGYLARLILRRTIRFIKKLGLRESLGDIMNIQLNFLSQTYPEIRNHQEHILRVIELEEKRYQKTIRKGHQMVKKSIKYLKKDKKDEMPLDMLIKLYDSQGLPPDTVEEVAREMNFQVNVPDNFYTLVAAEHSEEAVEEKTPVELDFPETSLLFYDEPQKEEFSARYLGNYENNIILDQLTFGEKVDSPTAIKLPVLFAVSLLKDRNGVIDVNLPISGSLDDPQFSVGGIVLRAAGLSGIAVLAHPYSLGRDDFIPRFVGYGLMGLEAYYPEHAPGMTSFYLEEAEKYGLLVTGGSDCHGAAKPEVRIGSVKIPYELVEKLKGAKSKLYG